ncbi:MAG: helix-turn-helix domain-containing protein [Candidatus Peribacteraceae bacterium]|nr:helix-turn-helix domain-containing protein [Candidatus Peribacteraceae bacterium]
MPPTQPQNSSLRALLKRIGLEEKEIEIYLAMLTLKSAKASDIARLAKQSRSHAYLMLRSLEQRGLVSEVDRGNILHFVAEPPESLVTYLENQEDEIRSLRTIAEGAVPQLKSLTQPLVDRPHVTLLHGLQGMKQIYRSVLKNEFVGLFNAEKMYEAFGENIVTKLFGKNERLQGRDLLVDNDGAKRYTGEVMQDEEYQIRLLPKNITFGTDTIVYEDTVAMFSYDSERTIVRIENQNIANAFRSWFEVMWASGTE